MRGAECWSDHRMVRARLSVMCRKQLSSLVHTKGVKHLKVNEIKSDNVRIAFNSKMAELLNQRLLSSLPAKDKLASLVDSTKEAAQQHLSADSKRAGDWFKKNEYIIKPALERRSKLLCSKTDLARVKYVKQKDVVQKLIRHVKNKWFQAKAADIELKMSRSRSAWKNIKQLQQARRGLRPVTPRALKNEDGTLCESADECNERWKRGPEYSQSF